MHSGKYGGPVPDALTAMCRLIATLHDAAGDVAVKGLHAGPPHATDFPESLPAGNRRPAAGREVHRRRAAVTAALGPPAIAVLGIGAPAVAGAAHKIVPACQASISVRLAPGDDAGRAFQAIRDHLLSHAPWDAEVTVTQDHQSEPFAVDTSGPVFEAFRRSCVDTWGRLPVKPAAAAPSRSRPPWPRPIPAWRCC